MTPDRATPTSSGHRPVRRRPKNRRAQIAAEAAAAFGAHGYHGVSMDDIARRLDLSSAALYRHFPSKYALFREELFRLARLAGSAVVLPDGAAGWPADRRLDHVVSAIVAETVANRSLVALTRWERRYLEPPDLAVFDSEFRTAIAALRRLIGEVRPDLHGHDRAVRAVAVFSVISSIGDHHATLPAKSLDRLLRSAAWALIRGDLSPSRAMWPPGEEVLPHTFKHEVLLREAIELFHQRGYPNVSMEDIAGAADLSAASAVYRYYRSKSDLLTAAFRRVADRMSAAIPAAAAATPTPAAALTTLIDLYVAGSFNERALTFVYYAELGHVDAPDQVTLRHLQQLIVVEWAKLVVGARAELSPGAARILVHAGFSLVVDLGRAFTDAFCPPQTVAQLLETTMIGHTRTS